MLVKDKDKVASGLMFGTLFTCGLAIGAIGVLTYTLPVLEMCRKTITVDNEDIEHSIHMLEHGVEIDRQAIDIIHEQNVVISKLR